VQNLQLLAGASFGSGSELAQLHAGGPAKSESLLQIK
jgi:hypothetical protein